MSGTQTYLVRTMVNVPIPIGTLVAAGGAPRSELYRRAVQRAAARARELEPGIVAESRSPQLALELEVQAGSAHTAIALAAPELDQLLSVVVPYTRHNRAQISARRKD